MAHTDDQMIEIIKESISLEKNGKYFYERAASLTDDKLGKAMFKKLAEEEDGHMEVIGKIFTSITGNEDWREIADQEMQKKGTSPVVEQLEAAIIEREGNQSVNDSDALKIAMSMERKAIWFFEELARKASDPEVRGLAESLADEERYHYDLLQSQYDNVLNMGFWLDYAEFRMDAKY